MYSTLSSSSPQPSWSVMTAGGAAAAPLVGSPPRRASQVLINSSDVGPGSYRNLDTDSSEASRTSPSSRNVDDADDNDHKKCTSVPKRNIWNRLLATVGFSNSYYKTKTRFTPLPGDDDHKNRRKPAGGRLIQQLSSHCATFATALSLLLVGVFIGAILVMCIFFFIPNDPSKTIQIPSYADIWGGNDVQRTADPLQQDHQKAAGFSSPQLIRIDEDPTTYPGSDADHMHGVIGIDKDGSPGWSPQPLNFRMTLDQKKEAHKGYCFNTRVSDSIPLDRKVPDFNESKCHRRMDGYTHLPSTSVIIVFYNENFSVLLRSIHSVLNRTPPHLLREVILVDDFSDPNTHPWLQTQLDEYIKLLPKTRIRRLFHRHGLMMARMAGVEWASGDVMSFLDSHIECAKNWVEPLLARIQEDYRYVVMPMIHTIGFDDFTFQGSGISVLAFSWSLGQSFINRVVSNTDPVSSPVMAGGLFSINRQWFLELGGYDPEMRLYGGEEMEISFKIWQCGGRLELIPCSRVGHVFRSSQYWVGQVYKVPGEEIHRNKLRAAEVWMDEYAAIAKLVIPKLPNGFELGSIEEQKALRSKLQCKPFKWYLNNIYPELLVPDIDLESRVGAIANKGMSACVDTLGNHHTTVGAYPCHYQHGTQAFLLGPNNKLSVAQHGFEDCLKGDKLSGTVKEVSCIDEGMSIKWTYDDKTKQLKQGNYCMEVVKRVTPKSPFDLVFVKCDANQKLQTFDFPLLSFNKPTALLMEA